MGTLELKKQIAQAISLLLEIQTTEDLIHSLDEVTKRLDFSVVSYELFHPIGSELFDGPVILFLKGFPDETRLSYINEKLYLDDPLLKVATRTGQPFWWHDVEKIAELTEKQKKFMRAFAKSGLGNGFAIPTYGPNGRNGYFGMGIGTDDRQFPENTGKILQLYCQALHLKYCELTRGRHEIVNLSKKEREVMTHVVHGLSTNQIASVMGVSANTVNTHLKRIYTKLGVQDRVSATLRFLASGQIYE